MWVVALTGLSRAVESEAPALAPLLGLSVYDVRARLGGALPKVVLQTAEDAVARKAASAIAARGHGVVVCDAAAAVPTAQMVRLHRFTLDEAGVWANDRGGERLAWNDVGAVVVALLRSSVARTREEVDYPPPSAGMPARTTVAVTKTEHPATHAAYFFPHRRAASSRPWVLEEATAQFLSLGAAMQPTRRANFLATVAAVRRLARGTPVDDRFVASPLSSPGVLHTRGADPAPPPVTPPMTDLTMHILAGMLLQHGRGPYRG